ncbi:MAG: MoaD/ThiS family protein [Nitrososphaerales archaeon]
MRVKLLGSLKSLMGGGIIEFEMKQVFPKDLLRAINDLASRSEKETVDPSAVMFIVNGSALELKENQAQVIREEDEIVLLPISHGG